MLAIRKVYMSNLWKVRKHKLYGDPCSSWPEPQSSATEMPPWLRGKNRQVQSLIVYEVRYPLMMYCSMKLAGFAELFGYMVNGINAEADF